MQSRFFIAAGAATLAIGVAMGAIGSHAAASAAHPEAARLVQTAVLYQLVHGLGMVIVGILARLAVASRLLLLSGALMLAGVLAFCGSLYVLAFLSISLGPAAPAGGIAFMAAWLMLVLWSLRAGG